MTNLSRALLNNQNTVHQLRIARVSFFPRPKYTTCYRIPLFSLVPCLFLFIWIQNFFFLGNAASIYSGRTTRGISEAAEKLANMSLSSGRQAMRQSIPPPMKAGGWHGQSNMFMGRSQEIQPSRAFTRRVAG